MKAEMNELGVVTLRPETSVEAYALQCWAREAWVQQEDTLRATQGHWSSSKLIVADRGRTRKGGAMKTSELTGAQLDYWVARAEGVEVEMLYGHYCAPKSRHHDETQYEIYTPSFDWAQGGPLIDKYRFEYIAEESRLEWYVQIGARYGDDGAQTGTACSSSGSSALQAICRAVVRAKFGDEVPDA